MTNEQKLYELLRLWLKDARFGHREYNEELLKELINDCFAEYGDKATTTTLYTFFEKKKRYYSNKHLLKNCAGTIQLLTRLSLGLPDTKLVGLVELGLDGFLLLLKRESGSDNDPTAFYRDFLVFTYNQLYKNETNG